MAVFLTTGSPAWFVNHLFARGDALLTTSYTSHIRHDAVPTNWSLVTDGLMQCAALGETDETPHAYGSQQRRTHLEAREAAAYLCVRDGPKIQHGDRVVR